MKKVTYLCDKCDAEIEPAESGWQYYVASGVGSSSGGEKTVERGHLCDECAKLSGMKLPKRVEIAYSCTSYLKLGESSS